MKKSILLIIAAIAISACDKPSNIDKSREHAKVEGQEAADANVEAEKKALAERAKKAEEELRVLYRFYDATSGLFEGEFEIKGYKFIAKIRLFPSIAIIDSDRVRTLEEIAQDKNNLHLKAQLDIYRANSSSGVYNPCKFDAIKPDMKLGAVRLAAESCTNVYILSLSDGTKLIVTPANDSKEAKEKADLQLAQLKVIREGLSAKVLAGEIKKINSFHVGAMIANNPKMVEFNAIRKEDLR